LKRGKEMTRDDIIRMARETGLEQVVSIALDGTKIVSCPPLPELERFATLVAAAEREKLKHELLTLEKWKGMALAKDGDGRTLQEVQREAREAEREKVAKWMIQRSYATGHGDTLEDLLQELDWQIADGWNRALINGVETEREQCAKLCEEQRSIEWVKATMPALIRYEPANLMADKCAAAIRARGKK
jgi:hypothetical protein